MTCADLFMFIRKRSDIITLIGMLACFLVVAGCGKQSPSVGTTPGAPPEVGVDVVKPQRVVLMTELSGRTSAYLIAEVRPQVAASFRNACSRKARTSRQENCSTKSTLPPIRLHTIAQRQRLSGLRPMLGLRGSRQNAIRSLSQSMLSVSRTLTMQAQRLSRPRQR